MYVCVCVCLQTWAAMEVAGLADCCIIFGRAALSLWRASLKSAGSLRLPSQAPGVRPSPDEQARWLLQQHTTRWSRGLYTAQQPQHYATHRWLDCLLADERYIFTGVRQVDEGDPTPLSLKTNTQI